MKLIIGLGNPGTQYKDTRHNAGFLFLDALRAHYNFPQPALAKKFNALITQGFDDANEKIILAAPQTFMNHSGRSVRVLADFYKIPPEELIVAHDDLDIIIGAYKIAQDAGPAGHNGVQNIIDTLGTQNFTRIRIGVEKKDGRAARGAISGHDFVLQKFTNTEMAILQKTFTAIIRELF